MKRSILLCYSVFCLFTFSQAQINWQHLGGPEGGSFYYLYENGKYVFASDANFFYRSSDAQIWEKLPFGNLWPLTCDSNTIAAGSGFGFTNPPQNPALMVSHDDGTSWVAGNLPPTSNGGYFSSIAVGDNGIYIPDGHSEYVYKTTDDGLTWDSVQAPGMYCYDLWSFQGKIYTEWSNKFWRLSDDELSWALVSPDFSGSGNPRRMFVQDSIWLFSTERALFGSNDYGQTWQKTTTDFNNGQDDFAKAGNRIYKMMGASGLLYTEDGGQSWQQALPYNLSSNMFEIGAVDGQLLLTNDNQGVFRFDENTGQLVEANTGLESGLVFNLDYAEGKLWVGSGLDVFNYDIQTQDWTAADLPLPGFGYSYLATSENGHIACGSSDRNVFISTDKGASWDAYSIDSLPQVGWVTNHGLCWAGDNVFLYDQFGSGTYMSSDFGQSFNPTTRNRQITEFKGKYYSIDYQGQLYISNNQGLTWQLVATDLDFIWKLFACDDRLLAIARKDLIAWSSLFSSEDGVNWSYSNDGTTSILDLELFNDLNINSGGFWHVGNKYFLHASPGFYVSLDTCKSWLPITRTSNFSDMVFNDSVFYAAKRGVFKTGIPQNYEGLASGLVYKDDNNNGSMDAGEIALPGIGITSKEVGNALSYWYTHSTVGGHYALGISPGSTDTIRIRNHSQYIQQINPQEYIVNASTDTLNFGIHFTADLTDVSVYAKNAILRPGFSSFLWLTYKNEGTLLASGDIGIKLPPGVSFEDSNPPPSGTVGVDSIFWNYQQLQLFSGGRIKMTVKPSNSLPIGTQLHFHGSISTDVPDINLTDNFFEIDGTLMGSFDPNEKLVDPSRGLTAEEIAAGKELLYTINFQNTGNYPAERVRITDMLDTALNYETLRLVAASHPITEFNLKPGGLLEIVFDNIALADSSSNEPASHGFVTFAVQRYKNYSPYFRIRNRAAIYFDFNDPIITNTVETRLYSPSVSTLEPKVKKTVNELLIMPNPANEYCRVSVNGLLSGPGVLMVTDNNGKLMYEKYIPDVSLEQQLSLDRLPNGVYHVVIKGSQGRLGGKLIVFRD
ncbi:MAG: hypothetical protein R3A50_00710 [Saprospiraceae bacterium]|nr:hypothetical protein [Saprospiraceae bacterium]MCB9345542.1 hypothetical protein [Lewinellaceae bacterium]